MARKSKTYSRAAIAFDTRTLQSNIRSFSEVSSTTLLGIDRWCADLDSALTEAVRLRTAVEVFSLRGEGEERRHNLLDRRKVFQKEEGTPGPLTRLTS